MSIKTLCVTFGFSLSSTWPYYQHHDPTKWQTETLLARCQVHSSGSPGQKTGQHAPPAKHPRSVVLFSPEGLQTFSVKHRYASAPTALLCAPPRFFAEELDHDAASELSVIGCERDVKSKSGLLIRGRERVRIMT